MQEGGLPGGALSALAIFPLPDVVLFPHALLPLHIFEPRYREMIADVLAGARMLAVARHRPGYEDDYQGRPAVFPTAGVGACIAADRLPDGRYDIVLRGVGRVHIDEELPPDRAYRVVRARPLIDSRSSREADVAASHAKLIGLCDRLAAADGAEVLGRMVRAVPSPGGCADLVASALVRDPDERQRLLETLDPADRLDEVVAHISALVAQLDPGGRTLN
jgi:Lon protease-like protein